MKAIKFIVTGKVQGVSFRRSTKVLADKLGVCGWIRNNINGTVDGFMQGRDYAIEKMLEFLSKGPPQAVVEKVEKITSEENRELVKFNILS